MDTARLEIDRFLRKDPNQTDQTKGAAYAALNPAPKRGDDALRKIGRPKGSEEDDGAPNILTGTVIVSCFIQTSALPSRIEMEGNDLTFFDDTFAQGGRVIGDTSRLIFTHGSGKSGEVVEQGFILEKRASVYNTYDNVLSWYAVPAKPGAHNYMFIGRDARQENYSPYVHSIHFAINNDTNFTTPTDNPLLNGIFEVEYFEDAVAVGRTLIMGRTGAISPDATGYSSIIIGGDGGVSALGYQKDGQIFLPLQVGEDPTDNEVKVFISNLNVTSQSGTYLGYYPSSAALTAAHPTASAGDWAYVSATGTVWLWTSSWANTGESLAEIVADFVQVNVLQFVPGEVETLAEGQMAYHDDGVTQQFRANAGGFFGSVDLTGV
jgi:hypothetical protein